MLGLDGELNKIGNLNDKSIKKAKNFSSLFHLYLFIGSYLSIPSHPIWNK